LRAGDVAPLVILVIMFFPSVWLSYQMITKPARFPKMWLNGFTKFFSKLIPGFDYAMFARTRSFPFGKIRVEYYLEDTTGSPERDAKIERFDRLCFRVSGILLALLSVLILIVILAIATGELHAE